MYNELSSPEGSVTDFTSIVLMTWVIKRSVRYLSNHSEKKRHTPWGPRSCACRRRMLVLWTPGIANKRDRTIEKSALQIPPKPHLGWAWTSACRSRPGTRWLGWRGCLWWRSHRPNPIASHPGSSRCRCCTPAPPGTLSGLRCWRSRPRRPSFLLGSRRRPWSASSSLIFWCTRWLPCRGSCTGGSAQRIDRGPGEGSICLEHLDESLPYFSGQTIQSESYLL